jgi:hypothetical protein
MNAYESLPIRALVVTWKICLAGDTATQLVVLCRFAVVKRRDGRSRIALEILFDPDEPMPLAPYYCDRSSLVRKRLKPSRVLSVRPYQSD